jgi:hypothetical protein
LLELSGSASYEAGELNSDNVKVEASGAARATVRAAVTLDASVSGASRVRYYGAPDVSSRTSGDGRVERLGDK